MNPDQLASINEYLAYLIAGACILILLGIAQLLHLVFKIPAEHTRKFLHVTIGLLCIIYPFRFTNHWIILGSTVFFTGLLWFSRRKELFRSIKHQGKISQGDILFPLAIYINYLFFYVYDFELLFMLPLLILTLGDPAAYYGGKIFGKNNKSLAGFIAFILISLLAGSTLMVSIDFEPHNHRIYLVLISAIVGAIVELITRKGWDNLSIPIALCVLIAFYLELWS